MVGRTVEIDGTRYETAIYTRKCVPTELRAYIRRRGLHFGPSIGEIYQKKLNSWMSFQVIYIESAPEAVESQIEMLGRQQWSNELAQRSVVMSKTAPILPEPGFSSFVQALERRADQIVQSDN